MKRLIMPFIIMVILIIILVLILICPSKANATAIVGLVDKKTGDIYFVADSQCTTGDKIYTAITKKVFCKGEFIIGAAGDWIIINTLQNRFVIPKRPRGITTEEYMSVNFINALTTCFKENSNLMDRNGGKLFNGQIIVGYQGRIFLIGAGFSVTEPTSGYAAVGSGANFCLGSLYSTTMESPITRLKKAIEAAEVFDAGVSRPFYVIHKKGDEIVSRGYIKY